MPWFIMVRDRRLHEVLRQTCRSGQTELRAGRHLWVTFLMDCPRCRLQVRVYYRNSFLTSGTFGLLPNSTLIESRTQVPRSQHFASQFCDGAQTPRARVHGVCIRWARVVFVWLCRALKRGLPARARACKALHNRAPAADGQRPLAAHIPLLPLPDHCLPLSAPRYGALLALLSSPLRIIGDRRAVEMTF